MEHELLSTNADVYVQNFETSQHNFSEAGLARANALLRKIQKGDRDAQADFLELIAPWIEKNRRNILRRLEQKGLPADEEIAETAITNALEGAIAQARRMHRTWVQFHQTFNTQFLKVRERAFNPTSSLEDDIILMNPEAWNEDTDGQFPEEPSVSIRETLEDRYDEEVTPMEYEAMQNELRKKSLSVLKTLTYKERTIIELRYGLEDSYTYTLEEVGRILKMDRNLVSQFEAKAIRKLQHPVRSRHLEGFVEENAGYNLERKLARQDSERAQRKLNWNILRELARDIAAERTIIRDLWTQKKVEPNDVRLNASLKIQERRVQQFAHEDMQNLGYYVNSPEMKNNFLISLHSFGFSDDQVATMQAALDKLTSLMRTFEERGGKPVDSEA